MEGLDEILALARSCAPGVDEKRLALAWAVAVAHAGPAGDGIPARLSHALEAARIVCRLRLDASSICAALVLGVAREAGPSKLQESVGEDAARLAEGVAGLSRFQFSANRSAQADSYKKMLVAMARDIRVLLVKMADRLQELRELAVSPDDAARRIAEESMLIYGPLAERLGISWLRTEIEDTCFRILWPDEYEDLRRRAEERLAERQEFITGVIERVSGLLNENGMKGFQVFGRQKNLYGIRKKMLVQNIPLEKVYDFVAFRVIVDKVPDCWQVLGQIHNIWTPIPSRFKDFINVPKPNGYRSLHTSVFGPLDEPMEIQIRTWQMHHDAESGIAAHWSYKESGRLEVRDQERFNWLKQLVQWAGEIQGREPGEGTDGGTGEGAGREPGEGVAASVEEMRDHLFEDQVFVFTPQGDLRVLRQGATALDFAYDVHTQVGHSCSGARVNGRLVPLSTELASGDMVEVLTSRTAKPRRDWLNIVVTSRARTKIKSWMLEEERREALEIGRQLLEKEFRKAGPDSVKHMKSFFTDEETGRRICESFRIGTRDELIRAVGHGKLEAVDVVRASVPARQPDVDATSATPELTIFDRIPRKLRGTSGILVDGIDGVLVHMAGCCNPIPGDEIVGFVTRGRGVTIHNSACRSVVDADFERIVPARWVGGLTGTFNTPVRLVVEDVPGVLAAVTTEVSSKNANIAGVSTRKLDRGRFEVNMVLQVTDQKMLDSILRSLRRLKGMVEVERVRQVLA